MEYSYTLVATIALSQKFHAVCDTIGGILSVGKCQSEDFFVLAQNLHKGLAREISHETGRGREKEDPRQKRTEESREESSQRTGQLTVNRSQGKPTARMCGLRGRVGQREKMSQCSWWLCGNFTWTHACNSSQNARKASQTFSFLHLEFMIVCSLFFHPLSCVYCVLCVHKEMWKTPGQRWEKPLDNLMAMSSLGGWDSQGQTMVYCHRYHTRYDLTPINYSANIEVI